jgi:hypothetical protein
MIFFLFNLKLKKYNFTICYQQFAFVISVSHAYHGSFLLEKNISYKKKLVLYYHIKLLNEK